MESNRRGQAAVDFMISYGIAILIIALAVFIILRLGIFGSSLTPVSCTPSPGFACGTVVYNANGLVTMSVTQATGAEINVTGVACSTGINTTGNKPQFGNIYVQSNSIAFQYYTGNALSYGLTMYSGTSATLSIYCYNGGGIASGPLGSSTSGYVWFNYTSSSLPSTYHSVQRVVQFTAKLS